MMKDVTLGNIIGKKGIFNDGDWVESKDQDPNGEVRLIQLADIGDGEFINKSNRYLTFKRAEELKCTFLKAGDVLIARMPDPIGRACIFPEMNMPCITVVDVCILRPDPKLADNEWLKLLLNSIEFRQNINQYITGTTRKRISRGNLSKIKFTLPLLEDQQRIASVLSKVKAINKQREKSILLIDEFLKYTFLEMFGNPVENEKGWTSEQLSSITKVGTGGTPSRRRESEFFNGDIYWAKTTEVNGSYIIDTEEKITELAIKESNCKIYPVSTILIAMYGQGKTRGNVGYLKIAAATNQACAALPPSEKINQIFLFEQLKHFYDHMRSLARGGNQENLNLNIVSSIKIIIPEPELQNQFSQIVEQVEKIKGYYKESLDELKVLFDYLSQKAFNADLDIVKTPLTVSLDIIEGETEVKGSLEQPKEDGRNFDKYEPIERKERYVLIEKRLTAPLLKRFVLEKYGSSNFSFGRLMKDLNEESYKTEYFQIRELVFSIINDNFLIQDFHNPEDGDKKIFISNDGEAPVEDQTFRIFLKANEAY